MKILVIPDVHNKIGLAERIATDLGDDCDKIVFLGDYFDSYDDTEIYATETAEWFVDSIRKKNRIHLMGNHDLHYLVSPMYACSGYRDKKRDNILKVLKRRDFSLRIGENMPLRYWAGDVLITHAGVSAGWWGRYVKVPFEKKIFETLIGQATRSLENREYSDPHCPMIGCGVARGGRHAHGGLLWNDYKLEFSPIDGLDQVFGHTYSMEVRRYEMTENYCIDNSLRSVAVIEDNRIKIVDGIRYGE